MPLFSDKDCPFCGRSLHTDDEIEGECLNCGKSWVKMEEERPEPVSEDYLKIPVPEDLDIEAAETLIKKNLMGSMDNAEEMMEQDDNDFSSIFISNRISEMSYMLENLEKVEERPGSE